MLQSRTIFVNFFFAVLFFFFPLFTFAGLEEWRVNFDDYSTGNINSQFGWVDTDGTSAYIELVSDPFTGVGRTAKTSNTSATPEIVKIFDYDLDNRNYVSIFFESGWLNNITNQTGSIEFEIGTSTGTTTTIHQLCEATFSYSFSSSEFRVSIDTNITTSNFIVIPYDEGVLNDFSLDVDFVNSLCRVNDLSSGSSTPWSSFQHDISDSVDYLRVEIDNNVPNGNIYFDNIFTNITGQATSTSQECLTCTRIIETDPELGEILASTTDGYITRVDYYVANQDFCNVLCTTYAEISIVPPLTNQKFTYNEEVSSSEHNVIAHYFENISATGTYQFEIRLYNRYLLGLTRSDLKWQVQKFSVGQETTQSQADAFASSSRESDYETIINLEDGTDDTGTQDSPGVVTLMFRDTVNDFLHLPPWGYVVVFNQTIQNGTSSTLSDLTISFPTSSPAHNITTSLPLGSAVDSAITSIRSEGVLGEHGDSYDTIVFWWNTFWYLAFIFWILKEVTGFSFGSADSSPLIADQLNDKQRKKMTLDLQSEPLWVDFDKVKDYEKTRGKTLNMRL